ncbi:hypothetical protein O181_019137 [Austropuccinia psidii MF-1]|uniref:Uncharacterized protein n=1 Tax=Austropuccinia psidii MF-1 TaxID=1389203 RepID=A0A9Q3C953_9BASI|nr:hypothetical protein [Austropuccinia psidii MF-1]
MPVQHSPPARKNRSQARGKAVLTQTTRAPPYGTPEVPQLTAHLDRGPVMEGAAPSIQERRGPRRLNLLSGVVHTFPGISKSTLKGPGKDDAEEGSDITEDSPTLVGASQGTGGPTLGQSNHPFSHQSEPFFGHYATNDQH